MNHSRESRYTSPTSPITRCALSWRGWIWRAFDAVLDLLLLAAAGTMIGYALANLCY
jgi:hypothetical protein